MFNTMRICTNWLIFRDFTRSTLVWSTDILSILYRLDGRFDIVLSNMLNICVNYSFVFLVIPILQLA